MKKTSRNKFFDDLALRVIRKTQSMFVCLFVLFVNPGKVFLAVYQLMWAWGAKACVLKISPEYPFTDLKRMDSWVGWTVLMVQLWSQTQCL